MVVFDSGVVTLEALMKLFWESHDPAQGMRQGNDIGTQYRSAIFATTRRQQRVAEVSKEAYQKAMTSSGKGKVTTEIRQAPSFYYAEEYHQQYLAKNVNGYCGLGGTGVCLPPSLDTREVDQ